MDQTALRVTGERLYKEHLDARRRQDVQRAKERMREKAADGGTCGPAPLGYVNRRQGNRTWVEVDPKTGPLVAGAFALATNSRRSLREIVALLEDKGLRTRRGKRLQAISLQRILTNPFYAGTVRYAGTETKGGHEPLVSHAVFNRVQRALARRNRKVITKAGGHDTIQ